MIAEIIFDCLTIFFSAKKGGIGVAMPTSNSASNGFKIFCDEEPGIQSSLPPSTGEWQMPPTEPVIKRENTQKPGKWTDAKVQCRTKKQSFSLYLSAYMSSSVTHFHA